MLRSYANKPVKQDALTDIQNCVHKNKWKYYKLPLLLGRYINLSRSLYKLALILISLVSRIKLGTNLSSLLKYYIVQTLSSEVK